MKRKRKGLWQSVKKKLPERITFKFITGLFVRAALLIVFVFLLVCFFRAGLSSNPATPIFEDRNGNFLSEGVSEYARLGFWDMPDPIPARVRDCVLASEDKRFDLHMGVDFWALGRAIVNNLDGQNIEGASTIAMQVVRLQHPGSRTLWAKFNEMVIAWFMTVRHGHENVLRHYLKIAPQGNQVYGFAYAARRYFKKPAGDLSWAEAALLAALPQSPSAMNPFDYWGFQRAVARGRLILRRLFQERKLDREEYRIALQQLSEMPFQFRETRPEGTYHFTFRVIDEFQKRKAERLTSTLRTTLDLQLQERLQDLVRSSMNYYHSLRAGNIAVMVVDRPSGEVLAYIGSDDYFNKFTFGSINYARVKRSSGSTVKPFLYALGLDTARFRPDSIVADLPFSIIGPKGEFSVGNFDDEYLGPMLYRRALANSRNTPTIRVLEGMGLERTYDFFIQCGLADGEREAGYYGYGLPVGGLYVTLEDLTAAYGILANDGLAFHLKWFVNQSDPPPRRVMSEYAAREITNILSDPLARLPSFPRLSALEFPFPVAVKTGTSQGYKDAWTVAYSRRYIVGVWIGHPRNEPMNRISGSSAALLLHDIVMMLHPAEARGVGIEPFPLPENAAPVEICALSGMPKGPDCPEALLEYFKAGTEPHDTCDVHRRYRVNRVSGELTASGPNAEERLFTVLPVEYASWGARQGYGKPPTDPLPAEQRANISLIHPKNRAAFLIDPELPRRYQTISLRAEVLPFVPELVWYVDGKEYARVPYPYETRWPLAEGTHSFQAHFPNAHVVSRVVTITVSPY